MAEKADARESVLTAETVDSLKDYLGFRHFHRHSYSFQIDWEKMKNLALNMEDIWHQVKMEIEVFMKKTAGTTGKVSDLRSPSSTGHRRMPDC